MLTSIHQTRYIPRFGAVSTPIRQAVITETSRISVPELPEGFTSGGYAANQYIEKNTKRVAHDSATVIKKTRDVMQAGPMLDWMIEARGSIGNTFTQLPNGSARLVIPIDDDKSHLLVLTTGAAVDEPLEPYQKALDKAREKFGSDDDTRAVLDNLSAETLRLEIVKQANMVALEQPAYVHRTKEGDAFIISANADSRELNWKRAVPDPGKEYTFSSPPAVKIAYQITTNGDIQITEITTRKHKE